MNAVNPQVLQSVGQGLAQAVHHRDRGLHALAVGLLLDAEPFLGLRLLLRHALADLVHQDLAAAARDAVEPRLPQLPHDLRDREAEALAEEDHLAGREPMDVDRVVPLDVAHQLEIPLERDVRVVSALEQDLHAADGLALVDLGADLLEAEDVPLGVAGPAVERAELAVGDADVGVVDVPVDDVGDHALRVPAPPLRVGELAQLQEGGVLVEVEHGLELT
jgi:hypothetical protein